MVVIRRYFPGTSTASVRPASTGRPARRSLTPATGTPASTVPTAKSWRLAASSKGFYHSVKFVKYGTKLLRQKMYNRLVRIQNLLRQKTSEGTNHTRLKSLERFFSSGRLVPQDVSCLGRVVLWDFFFLGRLPQDVLSVHRSPM